MHLIVQATILGLLTGGVYALMASGLTLAFGVMRVINVAQGAMIVAGAYVSYSLFTDFHIDPFLSIVIMAPLAFVVGCSDPAGLPAAAAHRRARGAVAAGDVGDRARHRGHPGLVYQTTYRSTLPSLRQRLLLRARLLDLGRAAGCAFAASGVILGLLYLLLQRTRLRARDPGDRAEPTSARLLGIQTDRVAALGLRHRAWPPRPRPARCSG